MNIRSRRSFIGQAGGALTASLFAASCGNGKPSADLDITRLNEKSPDGPTLKAGLVGCGGRGRLAAVQFINAGSNLQVTALADVFPDRVEQGVKQIEENTGQVVPESNRFVGFDGFQKVIDSGVDVVLLATPPHFRPEHFAAAISAGKHVFMEKPIAVDPVGIKSILESAGQAKTKGLSVVTGTQRHHQKPYVETLKRIADGAIGDIVAARCYWNQNQLWYRERQEKWSDMEFMIRDWVNWCWLSGDHIVEQHVHNIDVINWFTGQRPVKAVGFGARHRRITGDQYDFFNIDFEYENGMHCHSMCRQIDGCANNVSEFLVGTKGSANPAGTIYKPDGVIAWDYQTERQKRGESEPRNPYEQEHIDLVTSIRTSEPLYEAELTAISTLCAIMGRISAYTGKETSWEEMMDSDLRIGPSEYRFGDMDMSLYQVPVPGTAKT